MSEMAVNPGYVLCSLDAGERVLGAMLENLEHYGCVSISDLKELVGAPVGNPRDTKYGWTNLWGAEVYPVYTGFLLDLPNPLPI